MQKSTFQFSNPVLKSLVFELNEDFDQEQMDGISVESHIGIKKADNEAVVSLEIVLCSTPMDTSMPFYIKIEMEADFKWENDSIDVDNLLESNAPAVLLSYIRPYISSVTTGAGLPPYFMPFMNFKKRDETNVSE